MKYQYMYSVSRYLYTLSCFPLFLTAGEGGTMAVIDTRESLWPSLPLHAWQDTYNTLHIWMQIVGKIKLELAP
jgi:hypothetical protein